MINDDHVKAIRLTPEFIIALLSGDAVVKEGQVPEDARVIRYAQQWETHSAIVIIAHPSFAKVPRGEPIPIMELTL
jgi:hypothetical protein